MIKHLNKKKRCNRIINSYQYNDEDLYNLSLIKTENIKKETNFYCKICNEYFSREYSLKRHNIIKHKNIDSNIDKNKDISEDKNKDISEDENKDENKDKDSNIDITDKKISYNSINIDNSIHIDNSINITNNYYILRAFDEEWNIEHIDEYMLLFLLSSSKVKYTQLLNEILKNDENMNILIDKNEKNGIMYKNEKEQFVNMKKIEIYEKIMKKLKEQIEKLYREIPEKYKEITTDKINNKIYEEEEIDMKNKYKKYISDDKTKDRVNNILENIYIDNNKNILSYIKKTKEYKIITEGY